MWYVYILRCADRTLYTGTTTDISRRVNEHNRKNGGACTKARLPVKLAYKESYQVKSGALKRKAQIILRQAQDDPEQVKRAEGSNAGPVKKNSH